MLLPPSAAAWGDAGRRRKLKAYSPVCAGRVAARRSSMFNNKNPFFTVGPIPYINNEKYNPRCLYCEDTQKKSFPDFLGIVFGDIFAKNNGQTAR
jgi:thymidine kinase